MDGGAGGEWSEGYEDVVAGIDLENGCRAWEESLNEADQTERLLGERISPLGKDGQLCRDQGRLSVMIKSSRE